MNYALPAASERSAGAGSAARRRPQHPALQKEKDSHSYQALAGHPAVSGAKLENGDRLGRAVASW
jgi:hypothetical protein